VSFRSYSAAFVRHASGLLAVVILVVLFAAVTTLTLLSRQLDLEARNAERQRLELALSDEARRLQQELASAMLSRTERFNGERNLFAQSSLETRLSQAWQFFGFNSVYMIDAGGAVIGGAEHGVPAGESSYRALEGQLLHLLRDVYRSRQPIYTTTSGPPVSAKATGRASIIFDGFALAFAGVVPVDHGVFENRQADLIIGVRHLNTLALRDIGERYGLKDLGFRLSAPSANHAALPVYGSTGGSVGALVWEPMRPGSQLLPQLVAVAIAAVSLIAAAFAMLYRRLRRLALEFAKEEEAQVKLATLDHLTGLLNRRSFNQRMAEEIARCERNGLGFALHLIDLDRFKEVNDTLGHQAGDAVLRTAAACIVDAARSTDIVARLGGDEFAVLQIETATTLEAGVLATRIRDALRKPIAVGGAVVEIGCSIGITLAPIEGRDAEGLFALADSALYEAKNDGRNRHRFFESSIDQSLKMKQLVEEELREAIASNQLELHYQPQVSATGTQIIGVEALVRWRHPTRGLIPPMEFISLAEERGLIIPLNNWVLRRACEDGMRWPGLKVAVNISAPQFKQPTFAAEVMQTLADTGFDPLRLELELTEGMIVDDEIKAEAAILDLRSNGVRIALDDFGTGYSSLIYLRRFSFDKIKIDRSFLETMENTGESAILVHSVVHLGRALGLTVCAEGVETSEQHRFLQAVGCHELQGYVFSKPVLPAEIDRLLTLAEPFPKAA
jgi:diguanylate cyclase